MGNLRFNSNTVPILSIFVINNSENYSFVCVGIYCKFNHLKN